MNSFLFFLTGVYAFGFLFMLPQLFVNYKVNIDWPNTHYSEFEWYISVLFPIEPVFIPESLISCFSFILFQLKSVAHLPWKAFMYKVNDMFKKYWNGRDNLTMWRNIYNGFSTINTHMLSGMKEETNSYRATTPPTFSTSSNKLNPRHWILSKNYRHRACFCGKKKCLLA